MLALTSVVAVVLLAVVGCGADAPVETPPDVERPVATARAPEPEAFSEHDAMALPLERLRAAEDAWAALAGPSEGGVRAARQAASLARIRALREPEGDGLARARALLVEASLRRAVPGACDAALDLARLEARDAQDLVGAYLVAYRAARRWGDDPTAACASEALRMLGALEGHRPDRARLAAIDADPDADDPSVGIAEGAASAPRDTLEAWAAERARDGEAATLESIAVYGGDDGAASGVRVVLSLDRVTTFERLEIPAEGELPARLAIDLARTAPAQSLPGTVAAGAGGLVRVRQARRDQDTRVVLDLEPGATTRVFLLPQPFRVVVDVSSAAPVAVERSVARTAGLVVIDPGHGGADFGARAFGLREADIVLDLATRVREVLRRRLPQLRVVLTRERDVFVSLEQRAAMANAISADAFVSIHLNAADEPVDHGGVTTFVLDTTNDRQALRLAARENGTSTAEVGGLARILAGIRREEQVGASRALAERIHRGTLAGGRTVLPRLHDRGVRSAMFYVLVGATMPAVLVEASFMTRRDEAQALSTEAYRQALAEGIAEGIARWAEGR